MGVKVRMRKLKNNVDEIRDELFRLYRLVKDDIRRLENARTIEEFYAVRDIGYAHVEELVGLARLVKKGDRFLDVVFEFERVADEKFSELSSGAETSREIAGE